MRYLWALYGLAAVWGVRTALLPRTGQNVDVFFSLAAAVVVVLLMDTDSRARGRSLPAKWLLLFVWPVALPVYVIATRRLRGLWLVVKHSALLYVVLTAVTVGTRLVAFHKI